MGESYESFFFCVDNKKQKSGKCFCDSFFGGIVTAIKLKCTCFLGQLKLKQAISSWKYSAAPPKYFSAQPSFMNGVPKIVPKIHIQKSPLSMCKFCTYKRDKGTFLYCRNFIIQSKLQYGGFMTQERNSLGKATYETNDNHLLVDFPPPVCRHSNRHLLKHHRPCSQRKGGKGNKSESDDDGSGVGRGEKEREFAVGNGTKTFFPCPPPPPGSDRRRRRWSMLEAIGTYRTALYCSTTTRQKRRVSNPSERANRQ